jgi:hypothetical protein
MKPPYNSDKTVDNSGSASSSILKLRINFVIKELNIREEAVPYVKNAE